MLAKPQPPQIQLPKGWQGITPRFGAVGQHGSIALVIISVSWLTVLGGNYFW